MRTQSVSKSAFFNIRALIGLGFGSIGALLALVALVAFPSSALAVPKCDDVEFYEYQPYYGHMYVQMISDPGCTIYYTVSSTWYPADPTHSSAVYNPSGNPNYEGLGVPVGTHKFYKAFAHLTTSNPHDGDSDSITQYDADNTQN
jgi:hypothetical protein